MYGISIPGSNDHAELEVDWQMVSCGLLEFCGTAVSVLCFGFLSTVILLSLPGVHCRVTSSQLQ